MTPQASRFLALIVCMTTAAMAEQPLDPRITPQSLEAFRKHSFEHEGFSLPYRLMEPTQIEQGEKRPLLVLMHGKGERGEENQRQLIHGGRVFASPGFRDKTRAFVVAPQCPSGKEQGTTSDKPEDPPGTEADRVWTYGLSPKASATLDLDNGMTRQLDAASRLVDHLIETLPIDPDRVYLAGLSMGGYATWELIERDPSRWAAAVPICGAGDPTHASRLINLPIWAHHGAKDSVIPVERSREMITAIQAAGGKPIYSEYPDAGHDSWTPALTSKHVWDWVFAQRRGQ